MITFHMLHTQNYYAYYTQNFVSYISISYICSPIQMNFSYRNGLNNISQCHFTCACKRCFKWRACKVKHKTFKFKKQNKTEQNEKYRFPENLSQKFRFYQWIAYIYCYNNNYNSNFFYHIHIRINEYMYRNDV